MSERKFKTLSIPQDLHERITEISKKLKVSKWRVIEQAISLLYTYIKKPYKKAEIPILDKVSWYIAKVGMSVGALKENPTKENYEKTKTTLNQVFERLLVDTETIERAVDNFIKTKNTEAKMEVNMALKMLILDIIYKHIYKEKQKEEE